MLDYRLRLWAPTYASRAISAVAELLVHLLMVGCGNTIKRSLRFMLHSCRRHHLSSTKLGAGTKVV